MWAISAMGAQDPYKVKVTGSNPVSPTTNLNIKFLLYGRNFALTEIRLHILISQNIDIHGQGPLVYYVPHTYSYNL